MYNCTINVLPWKRQSEQLRQDDRRYIMFGVYFGKYLQDKGILTEEQLTDILEENKSARVKM